MAHIKKPEICGRLGQNEPYGQVDVCGEPADHEPPHRGKYHGMVWEDIPGKPHRAKIHGPASITSRIPPGGNIRGDTD